MTLLLVNGEIVRTVRMILFDTLLIKRVDDRAILVLVHREH